MNYDFRICKVCKAATGDLEYHLRCTIVYVCRQCGFHYTNHLDPLESVVLEVNYEALTQEIRN